jgi:hypothetical protein
VRGIYREHGSDCLRWHDIDTRFYDDQFRHLSNIKVFTSIISETTYSVLLLTGGGGGMKYTVLMASGGIIFSRFRVATIDGIWPRLLDLLTPYTLNS